MIRKILAITLLTLPLTLFGQTSGKISGKVTDKAGNALSGANIVVEGTSLGAASDNNGAFVILDVPIGTYTVSCDYIGYSVLKISNITVSSGLTSIQDFSLQKSTIEGEVVEVRAEKPLINLTATNVVRSITASELRGLPTRNASAFYSLQPGVVKQNDEIYIRGSRSDEVDYQLNGASTRSMVGTDNVISVIPEALEEIKVNAGGYGAELGGANGGIIQQTLRTGGEKLGVSLLAENETNYNRSNIVATVGGPLLGDKIRYFLALDNMSTDDYSPQYFYGAKFDTLYDSGDRGGSTSDMQAVNWDDATVPGGRKQEKLAINGTVQLDYNPLILKIGIANTTSKKTINSTPIYHMFNQDRAAERSDLNRLLTAKASYFIDKNTLVSANISSFHYSYDQYDPNFSHDSFDDIMAWGKQQSVFDALNDTTIAMSFDGDSPDPYDFAGFGFARPGGIRTGYYTRTQGYTGFGLDLKAQRGNHELKAGLAMKNWEIRSYSLGSSAILSLNQDATFSNLINPDSAAYDMVAAAVKLRQTGAYNYGYDEFMNESDAEPNGPKKPSEMSVYFSDKIELNDIVVNAGFRYDQYTSDMFALDNPANPAFDSDTYTVDSLNKAETKSILQPRLGLAFPVSDKTVFHLQYGKFAQMPDMNNAFESTTWLARTFGGQNFISDPTGFDFDPIITTQYEIGFNHQFADNASFDLTAYYKNTEGQITIERQVTELGSKAADYNVYVNGDFSVIRGFEATVKTNRVNGVQALLNYTLSDAKSTNSNPNGQVSSIENGEDPPTVVNPVMFNNKHTGSVILDYITSSSNLLTGGWHVNSLINFSSGHNYTRATGSMGQRDRDAGALLVDSDPRSRTPLEALNSSTTPPSYTVDIRLEKALPFGVTAYTYVENIFDRRNIINVYYRTGNASDDGFLSDESLSQAIVAAQGQEYANMYEAVNIDNRQHWISDQGYDLYGSPRQIFIGLRVNF